MSTPMVAMPLYCRQLCQKSPKLLTLFMNIRMELIKIGAIINLCWSCEGSGTSFQAWLMLVPWSNKNNKFSIWNLMGNRPPNKYFLFKWHRKLIQIDLSWAQSSLQVCLLNNKQDSFVQQCIAKFLCRNYLYRHWKKQATTLKKNRLKAIMWMIAQTRLWT